MKVFRSAFFYVVLVLSTLAMGLSSIIAFYLTKRHENAHLCGRLWGRINIWAAGVSVEVEGLENIEQDRPFIYAANHQSLFDILAAFATLPVYFRWLAKEELFKIPIFGSAMLANGAIPIDRSDRKKAFESLNKAAEKVQNGASIFIFPEGTRSRDGRLQEFKSGGFILAIRSQQPLVPISISGSYKVLPKKGDWTVNPGVIRMVVEKPIPTAGLTTKDRDALMTALREAIRRRLPQDEGGIAPDESSSEASARLYRGIR